MIAFDAPEEVDLTAVGAGGSRPRPARQPRTWSRTGPLLFFKVVKWPCVPAGDLCTRPHRQPLTPHHAHC